MAENFRSTGPPAAVSKLSSASVSRMSFASVAALPPKKANQVANVAPENDKRPSTGSPSSSEKSNSVSLPGRGPTDRDLSASLAKMDMKGQPDPQSDVSEHGPLEALRQSAKLDDEKTHLSISSTKAPSLDGKSIASITTFAMDEKESIRPDDSASVQAAEDEDSNSGPGSGAQNSRFGSEAGAKAFHSQLQEISLQRGTPLTRRDVSTSNAGIQADGVQAPLPVDAGPADLNAQGMVLGSQLPFCMPDEKLLEALEGTKDRLFLLQLEHQFISFIQDPQTNSLDLPPYNSFFRMLAHRLGDYYRLSHWADTNTNAVRLYKTDDTHYTQLPTPLSAYRRKLSSEEAPNMPPSMKIMRREGTGIAEAQPIESGENTHASSMVPSKAGSDAGVDSQKVSDVASPVGSTIAKDKAIKTREEKEAKYKEARDRIFADWKENDDGETNASNEASARASRASSVNGRKKKKSQKTDDDGFQARSAYNVYYPTRQAPGYDQVGNFVGYSSNPYMPQNGVQTFQPGFGQTMGQPFHLMQQSQFFPGQIQPQSSMIGNGGMLPQSSAPQQYMNYPMTQQPMLSQFYPQMHQPQNHMSLQPSMVPSQSPFTPQMPPRPVSQMSDQSWGQGSMPQSPFPVYNGPSHPFQTQTSQGMQQGPVTNPNNLAAPYPYGQLPQQVQSPGRRNVHPVPGSYNRQTFNAQSRVFVPGESGFISSGNEQGVRNISYAAGQTQDAASSGMGFSYPMPSMPQAQFPPSISGSSPTSPRKVSNQSAQAHSPAPSTISKWGTPSTLPPKPPPPVNQHMPNSMPTFQNGTYSKPASAPQDAKAH